MPEIYLSDRQIGERFGVHHLTPRRWVREDSTFPRPVKLSPGCRPVPTGVPYELVVPL